MCAGAGRALHGAGAALGNVSGMALVSRALSRNAADRAIAALLGAVALGEEVDDESRTIPSIRISSPASTRKKLGLIG